MGANLPSRDVHIIWDLEDDQNGNVRHIAEHGLTQEEVDDVLMNPDNPTSESESSGEPVTFGWTNTGRYIVVVWEHVLDDPWTIRPVTAYEVPSPKAPKKPKKRRRKE
jgi:uncharacterized DUF497 family protein